MSNTIKKFLRLIGVVWCTALTILLFAVLLLKIELVSEIFASPAVVAVVCILLGASVGFISGAIVSYLNAAKAIEVRDKRIEKLKNDVLNYRNIIAELQQNQQPKKTFDSKLGARILSQIAGLSDPSEDQNEDLDEANQEEEVDAVSGDPGLA